MKKPKRKDPKKALRKTADKLLQTWVRLQYKGCLICESSVGLVGHHFFTKASSNALRYYLPNIVPLCKACHCRVHTQPHLIVPKICYIMGQAWYDDLIEIKRAGIKETTEWYKINIETLNLRLEELK